MVPDDHCLPRSAPLRGAAHLCADVGIVGSGPAGLFATYYAGLRGLSVAIIDSLDEPGGQVAALYPDKQIYDVAAHPEISGRDLVDALVEQIDPRQTQQLNGHTVTGLHPIENVSAPRDAGNAVEPTNVPGWRLVTDPAAAVDCRVVVLSGGPGSFRPRRLPCADGHIDRGACYTAAPPEDGADRDVVVVGGGDSAVDCALGLSATARSVTLVHRSKRFRAHEQAIADLRSSSVDLLTSCEVVACHGSPLLENVTVRSIADATESIRPASLLVVSLGLITRSGPLREWGLKMDGPKVVVGSDMQTSLPGVFAIGDIATYPGKVPLIVTGFGEAATALNNAAVAVHPRQDVEPGHSSDRLSRPAAGQS